MAEAEPPKTPTTAATPRTAAQQPTEKREQKVAELRRAEAVRVRRRRILVAGGVTALVAGIAALAVGIAVAVQAPGGGDDASGSGGSAGKLDVVRTWTGLSQQHVTGTVKYEMSPPAGGPHNPVWLNCGIYDRAVPNENAVHDLEHGAVWITYDPDRVSGAKLAALKRIVPDQYATLSPYPGLDAPMAISAWGAQLKFASAADPKVADFIQKYWRSADAPEPGAPCTGGVDAPGRIG